jgi:catechol 2,3-dioxygenase-like lactoylglutathione lyase family enzyme
VGLASLCWEYLSDPWTTRAKAHPWLRSPVEEGGYEISNGNQPPHLEFGHLGFSVPNVQQAVERLRAAGVQLIKELNTAERQHIPLSEWEEKRGVGVGELHPNYKQGFNQVSFVHDPVSLHKNLSSIFYASFI